MPGTNASVERVFSIANDIWTDDKSRLSVNALSAILKVKFNLRNVNCTEFTDLLEKDKTILKKFIPLKNTKNK